ncbi:hydantoinase B/oxoprolinase family protein [Roseomonas terrae]|uniref:Hydantoinase B/oxoprolinase family protein n=2 Tax=Neoroseomonas terrae TaxID=424799 RepID=A0ABS5EBD5_9PROT|nr:hydantoinase B/oxoprolinase family protein [Neoroseomonas terrae]
MTLNARQAIAMQVMWNRLLSVVEEQAQTLIRTSFSPVTRDAGDLSAGIFTPDGLMIAQAVTGTPGHVNAMARSVGHFLAVIPAADWAEGDVVISNDPWIGTGHLNDFCVVTPVFRNGRLIAFFASTTHIVDVGGQGIGFDGRDVFHEGIRIPVLRFRRQGRTDAHVEQILRANVRFPDQLMGELFALVAGNEGGCRALLRMCDEFGLHDIDTLSAFIFERSAAGMRAAIAGLPEGRFETAMRVDLIGEPIEVTATMTVKDGAISLDLGGELTPHLRGVNVPFCYTEAYAAFGVRCIVGPDIPNNAASLDAVRISAPEGSILNATFPAPVASRHILGHMMADLALGCLAAAAPDRVPAEHSGTLWNLRLARSDGPRPFNILCFHSGGGGARPAQDGLAATAYPSGVQAIPVEVSERAAPVLYRQRALRPDSGGPGTWRGGLGQIIEVAPRDGAAIEVGASFQRVSTPARGRQGGKDGAPGVVRLASGKPFRAAGRQPIPAGDSLVVETPGGGGYGDPRGRDAGHVRDDVRRGLVTAGAARRDYGVEA